MFLQLILLSKVLGAIFAGVESRQDAEKSFHVVLLLGGGFVGIVSGDCVQQPPCSSSEIISVPGTVISCWRFDFFRRLLLLQCLHSVIREVISQFGVSLPAWLTAICAAVWPMIWNPRRFGSSPPGSRDCFSKAHWRAFKLKSIDEEFWVRSVKFSELNAPGRFHEATNRQSPNLRICCNILWSLIISVSSDIRVP